ncbi:hypothetical protein EDD16DRAFT_1126920 [Pisolithus croceorrhizus]|nr:hypothetical protein EDD16DRAFT_1126920 [Pisolithus croceorrhizus]KAI6134310.1 hypothetical protein EV401DRAFT_2064065 [Pisolithus croceorrhizus]KAI6146556.1 hypothetical protein EDD17DRAFT_100993 [Pisolithus thermaeus]
MSSVTPPTRTPVLMSQITPDDVVILIIEETEPGTNNFIDKLTKPEEGAERISFNTEKVCEYECYYAGQRFIFVVTPRLLQGAVFRTIAKWLEDAYRRSIELTGVIHIHSITNNSVSAEDVQSVKLLCHLCGNNAADRVRLVTTTCDQVEGFDVNNVEAISEITDWRLFIGAGARPERFDDTSEEAWKIVEGLENTKKALLLQEELVDREMRLEDTTVGKHIRPERWGILSRLTWLLGY